MSDYYTSQNQQFAPTLLNLLGPNPEKGFKNLFQTHYAVLCTFSQRYLAEPSDGEQCVLDVFTRMWENRAEIVIKTDLKYYLYACVRNRCMDHLRREKKSSPLENCAETPAQQFFSDDQLHHRQLLGAVEQAIATLPRECRRIFTMSRFDGLKYHEIAQELGLSIKTIESQMSRALRTIRPYQALL